MGFTTEEKLSFEQIGGPYLEFEISDILDAGYTVEDVIKLVATKYPDFKFSGTERRYRSCIMAIFEPESF